MSVISVEVKLDGISGFSPLYLPLEIESDLRVGFVEPTSDKIGNDQDVDITVMLSTWDLVSDFSGGAWHKDKELGAPTYDEPIYTKATGATVVKPLAWTLNENLPLMCGCGHQDQSGTYGFSQFIRFRYSGSAVYALSTKNSRVYRNDSETWTNITSEGSGLGAGTYTEMAVWGANDTSKRLYVGKEAGNNAKYWDGSDWNDAEYEAQHFVQVGKAWFYSNGNNLKKDSSGSNALDMKVGYGSQDINSLLWFNDKILVGKPEGLYVVDPVSKLAQEITSFPNQASDNCRFLCLHNGSAFFNAGEVLYELTSGFDLIRHRVAEFDGYGERPFVGGKVLQATSDGNNLYFCYKVTTETTYDYFLVIYTGVNGGFHPVLVVSVLMANDPTTYTTGGVWFDNNKLRYSFGNDFTGYLLTDGNVPMATGSIPFTPDVGVSLGWFDANRDFVSKWFKELRVSMQDIGSTGGQLRARYKKYTDTSFTDFPSDLTGGTQENAVMTPTAENSIAGFNTTRVNLQLELKNSDSTPSNAWGVKRAHLVGNAVYGKALVASINVLLDWDNALEHRVTGRSYSASTLYNGLLAGISQTSPIKLTLPNGNEYVGTLLPNAGGEMLIDTRTDANKPRRQKMLVTFREYK
jgi:hypothetical protein